MKFLLPWPQKIIMALKLDLQAYEAGFVNQDQFSKTSFNIEHINDNWSHKLSPSARTSTHLHWQKATHVVAVFCSPYKRISNLSDTFLFSKKHLAKNHIPLQLLPLDISSQISPQISPLDCQTPTPSIDPTFSFSNQKPFLK